MGGRGYILLNDAVSYFSVRYDDFLYNLRKLLSLFPTDSERHININTAEAMTLALGIVQLNGICWL